MAAVTAALVIGLTLARATERIDNVAYDTFSSLSVRPPSEDIVIVAIDNRSIAELGRWPWPRSRHEALLNELRAASPKAIAYDLLLTEPAPGDAGLAQAVKAAQHVYLPMTFETPGDNGAAYEPLRPVQPLRAASAGLGQVNVHFDADGVVRRAFLTTRDGPNRWPHLMEVMRRVADGEAARPAQGLAAPPSGPLVREQPVMISYAGPPGHFRTVSFADVVRGETPPAFLRDKLVLVGATADGLGDRYATPLSNHTQIMSGVELQANLLDTLLTKRAIIPANLVQAATFSLAPLAAALAGFLLLQPRANLFLGGVLAMGVLVASALLFASGRLWLPPTAALAGLALAYPLWSWRRLEAANAYMLQELKDFASEPDLLSALSAPRGGPLTDVVDRKIMLLHGAIERTRNLRRLVLDALQGLPDATLVTSIEGRVLIANREAESLFGFSASAEGSSFRLRELIASAVPSAEIDGGSPPDDGELAFADGRSFHVRRTTLTQAGGEPVGWIVRFTDITALKAAGRQREHILQLLTHDMRSPQVSILTLLGGLKQDLPPADLADRISGYARRTLSLADNFVNLARAETDSYALEPLNLSDVLVDAVDDLWPQSGARGIEVRTIGTDDEILVNADRSLLTRAFINLVDNAIKYSPPGSSVDCELRPVDDRVVCTIADQGRGMSATQVANLFERFRRGGSGDRVDGVGLGLSFVEAVIQRHGGTIDCSSAPGEGTTFTIALPLADPSV